MLDSTPPTSLGLHPRVTTAEAAAAGDCEEVKMPAENILNPRCCSDSGEEELTLGATQGEAPASRREAQIEEELEGRRLHNRFVNHHSC